MQKWEYLVLRTKQDGRLQRINDSRHWDVKLASAVPERDELLWTLLEKAGADGWNMAAIETTTQANYEVFHKRPIEGGI